MIFFTDISEYNIYLYWKRRESVSLSITLYLPLQIYRYTDIQIYLNIIYLYCKRERKRESEYNTLSSTALSAISGLHSGDCFYLLDTLYFDIIIYLHLFIIIFVNTLVFKYLHIYINCIPVIFR